MGFEMQFKKTGKKDFGAVYRIVFGNKYDINASATKCEDNTVTLYGQIFLYEADDVAVYGHEKKIFTGKITDILSEAVTEVELEAIDGGVISLTGKEMYDYFRPEIIIRDKGITYRYSCNGEALELDDGQIEQVDAIYDSANALLKTLSPGYEWDMEEIGQLADYASLLLLKKGHTVHFPGVVSCPSGAEFTDNFEHLDENASPNADALYNSLDYKTKDALYRKLWNEHVLEDVKGVVEEKGLSDEYGPEDVQSIIETTAERYVYQGDYDCNLSYWDNIDNLIDDVYQLMQNQEI